MITLEKILKHLESLSDIELFVIDLFCGAGGLSEGVERARINGKKCAKVVVCINHDKNAILSHDANIPDALHFIEDIRTIGLSPIIAIVNRIRELYPDAKIMLHASLECTNFSKAKGGQPRDPDSRTLAEHLFRYINVIHPDFIQIENVTEFMSWGDLDENGKPISADKGAKYQQWVDRVQYSYGIHSDKMCPGVYDNWYAEMRQLGSIKQAYHFDYRILNAADFGALTSRKRFFGIFAKMGLPIVFPEQTHCKADKLQPFSHLRKWRAVKEVLDFEDEGKSIFGRKKALSEKTLERIYAGLIKFVAGGKEQWILKYNSVNLKTKNHVPPGVDEPCPVISCQNRLGLVQTRHFLSKYYSGHPDSKNIPVDGPAHTIKCKDNHALVGTKFLAAYYGNGDNVSQVNSPCPTVPTKDRFALISPFVMNYYSGGGQHSDINDPSPAILANPKQRLMQCQFMDQQFGKSKPVGLNRPLGAVTANPKYNLVSCRPWVLNPNFSNVGSDVSDPSPTITANRKWHYLMNPQFASAGSSVNDPCFTLIARMDKRPPHIVSIKHIIHFDDVPDFISMDESGNIYIEMYETDSPMTRKIKEFMAIYQILDILMRMLKIPELKMIMGFPEDYKLVGTQAEQKKYIGNAVEVTQAQKNTEALCKKLVKLKAVAA